MGPLPYCYVLTWLQVALFDCSGEISYAALKSFLSKSVPAITPKALRDQTDFESECLSRGGVWWVPLLRTHAPCLSGWLL